LATGCAEADRSAANEVETVEFPIYNGTRDPGVVALSDGEELAIGWLHAAGDPAGIFCTGTLVAPRVVVTASHCTTGEVARDIGFGVGLLPSEARATFAVTEIFEHPQRDAAILILAEDATLRVPGLVPIGANDEPLPTSREGTQVEASGYGQTGDPNRDGRWFAALELETVGSDLLVVNGHGERGICFGDSGGPLLGTTSGGHSAVLAVESNGDNSCVGRDNMTRLDTIAGWMNSVTGGLPGPGETGAATDGDACQGLDYLGRCSGTVAVWCNDGVLQYQECGQVGCAYVNDQTGYYCGDTETEPDPNECTAANEYCDGPIWVMCEPNGLVRYDCGSRGLTCGFDGTGLAGCQGAQDGDLTPLPDETSSPTWADDRPAWADTKTATPDDLTVRGTCSMTTLHGSPQIPLWIIGAALAAVTWTRRRAMGAGVASAATSVGTGGGSESVVGDCAGRC
jgi:hypothetical protein